jgi:hypothetical protein
MSIGAIADIDVNEGRLDDAAERYAVGLPLMRSANSARGLVAYLHSMAELALMRGEPERALALVAEAAVPARHTQDVWHVALLASVRACAARDLGRPGPDQLRLTKAALTAATDQPDPRVLLEVIEHAAGVLADHDRFEDALRLLRGARTVREQSELGCSAPRRARRDADEAAAAQAWLRPPLVDVDLSWLVAAVTESLGRLQDDRSS